MKPEEFSRNCRDAIEALTNIAVYTENGGKELNKWEAAWLWLVILSFNQVVGPGDNDDDGGSDYRVDGTVY